MNTAKQVKALIRNLSRRNGVDPQILIRQYMMDHLLERISKTRYREFFILKGGMLISAYVGISLRTTLDMDATIKGFPLETETIQSMFNEIIAVEIVDGIRYLIYDIDTIHDESDYNGFRISFIASLDESRIPLKIDITTGDIITPNEIQFAYPMLLETRSINIFSYNLESILAEKLETILTRNIANTRMRDYYDIYILSEIKWDVLNQDVLKKAFSATCKFRGNSNTQNEIQNTFEKIKFSTELEQSWLIYQQRYEYARQISFADVCSSLEKLIYFA